MLKRKKILFVIDSLCIGGAEKSLLSLLSILNSQKYDIHLWIRCRKGELEALLPKNVEVISSPSYSVSERILYRFSILTFSAIHRFLKYAGIKRHLAEILWKCTGWATKVPSVYYDVAIAFQQGMPTYLIADKIKAKKKIAWVNTNLKTAGYNIKYNEKFYKKINHIAVVSNELQTAMASFYPQLCNKTQCILDIISPTTIRQQALSVRPFSIHDKSQTIIVSVGRLVALKQFALAVEAARILRDKAFSFQWYFIGEGSERVHLESLITKYSLQEHVILVGKQLNPYPYIYHCDVYVQTSSFEGFGLSIAEAKILGKPVVSTNFDAVYDQLQHEQNGLIADMTAESVAENIIRIVSDHELRQIIIRNVLSENNTTAVTEIKKIEELIDEN